MYQLCLFKVVAFLSVNLLSNATARGPRPPMEGRLGRRLAPSQISISLSLDVIPSGRSGGLSASADGSSSAAIGRGRSTSSATILVIAVSVQRYGSSGYGRSLQGLSARA